MAQVGNMERQSYREKKKWPKHREEEDADDGKRSSTLLSPSYVLGTVLSVFT